MYQSNKILALVFALSLVSFNLPTTAWAADVFHFNGNSAIAQFYSSAPSQCSCDSDPSCTTTSVFVFAADNEVHNPPGSPESGSFADAFIFKSSCEEILMNAGCFPPAPLADEDWQVGGGLNSATLRTRLECWESVSDVPFSVDIDLRWDGISPMSHGNTHSNSSTPGCKVHFHSIGTIRPTVTTGIVFDGINNYTPDPSIPDAGDNISAGKGSQQLIGCQ